ncbi:MAG: response regulator [Azospira oryzae]|jgi:two-component system chemotaxis response regulator CheY|nr:MAG: response regulator [Azospira oryzae]
MRYDILVIEDDEPLGWLLERILKERFNVTIATDGLLAMAWLTNGNLPDVILCDLDLPNIDGLSFLKTLNSSGAFNSIPVIMVTGSINPKAKEDCLAAGAKGYLEKPFDPPQLIEAINKVLKAKQTLV